MWKTLMSNNNNKLKFDQTNKWYMHNPYVVEYETHKFLWDFEKQTATQPDQVIINKKVILLNYELCCPGWPPSKIKRKWKER